MWRCEGKDQISFTVAFAEMPFSGAFVVCFFTMSFVRGLVSKIQN